MTVEEMQAQLDKMKDDILHMKNKISEYEHMISVIKTQNDAKFERAKKLEGYFMISFADGKARADMSCECYDELDNSRFDNNNYFKTRERTQEVAEKINFLLKLERLHDTFCPNEGGRYYITQNTESGRYCYGYIRDIPLAFPTSVMFPSEEIALKVCNILNEELEEQA